MYNILNLSKEQQKLLFETTARRMGVIPTVVEKDFWICIVLDYLFNIFVVITNFMHSYLFYIFCCISNQFGYNLNYSNQIGYKLCII